MIYQKDLLELAREKLGNVTYYRVGKRLGITSSYMTQLRKGKTVMSDELAFRLAEICDLPPEYVVASIECERWLVYGQHRDIDEQMAQMYHRIAAKFRAASILLVALGLMTAHESRAASVLDVVLGRNCQIDHLCIMRNWTRRARRLRKLLMCLKTFVAVPLEPPCAGSRSPALA